MSTSIQVSKMQKLMKFKTQLGLAPTKKRPQKPEMKTVNVDELNIISKRHINLSYYKKTRTDNLISPSDSRSQSGNLNKYLNHIRLPF